GMANWVTLAEFPGLRLPPPEPVPVPVLPGKTGAMPLNDRPAATAPAWERRQELGLVRAYVATLREVFFEPGNTFTKMNPTGGIQQPTGFFLLTMAIQAVFAFVFQALTLPYNRAFADLQRQFNLGSAGLLLILPLFLVLGIMLTVVINFVLAGFYHFALKLLGGTRAKYEATYRVVTYAQAAQLLAIVPCIGPVATVIFFLMAASIGLQRVHQAPLWKAALALVVPYALCLAALLSIVFAVLSAVNAAHHANI
ncbi:MAG TPA: YIP1 family protein, partial [Chthoniobacterales bacterium]